MDIVLNKIKIKDLCLNYSNNDEEGVYGYNGKLNIRPKYQREFVYDTNKRNEVIYTVLKGFPLNIMYWTINNDKTYELLDGQQRTISICEYVKGSYSVKWNNNDHYFHSLPEDVKEKFLNYELSIYFCEGTESEKLDWFKIVNIAGEVLNGQELRNAIFTGPWLTEAKRYFSKSNCPASLIAKDYIEGSCIRQEYLETVIKWISNKNIENYMAIHQNDNNCDELVNYFSKVIDWIKNTFIDCDKTILKGINWGILYNNFKDEKLDVEQIKIKIKNLLIDNEIRNKKGIIPYVLTKEEKHLNLRVFSEHDKITQFNRQKGVCSWCKKKCESISEMEADHITPWSIGGKTDMSNIQMLCKDCNRKKSNK